MSLKKNKKLNSDFDSITISLASPESILEGSYGEVTQPETINYRTYKPEMGGLFCERIFGPVKDWECHCGKYKRIRYKGIICDRCGVEVTEKKVRRERMGHIELVVPVAHIWYFRSLPNKIGYLLGQSSKKLDQIIYYERYVVVQPGIKAEESISQMDFLTEEEYLDILDKLPRENQMLPDEDPNKFIAKMGAEALYMLLSRIKLDELSYELRHQAATDTSQQRKAEALKRLKVVEAFRDSRTRIEQKYCPEGFLDTVTDLGWPENSLSMTILMGDILGNLMNPFFICSNELKYIDAAGILKESLDLPLDLNFILPKGHFLFLLKYCFLVSRKSFFFC